MKRSNIIGIIAAVVAVLAIVSLISWFLTGRTKTLLQGEVDATSYKASSKLAGRIEQMLVEEGQFVRKGDLLYIMSTPEIDAKVAQARAVERAAEAQNRKALTGARPEEIEAARSLWQQAQAALDFARKTYERMSNLYREGVIAAQQYDEATTALRAAEAAETAARSQYDLAVEGARSEDKASAGALVDQAAGAVSEAEAYAADSHIYAPVDGQVSSIIAREGELVGTGYPVVTIIDLGDIWVQYNIKETLLPRIKQDEIITAWVPALDRNVDFVVDYISVQADFATWSATRTQGGFDIRTFTVKTRPVSREPDLRPGMSAILDWDSLDPERRPVRGAATS